MEKKARNGVLDCLKFLFSIVVVLYHARKVSLNSGVQFVRSGYLGVEFFFVVSGVMLAASVERIRAAGQIRSPGDVLKSTYAYMKHRIAALMPNYYVALLIAFVVYLFGQSFNVQLGSLLVQMIPEILLITETGIEGCVVNQACWYLSAMLLVILVMYPLMISLRDKHYRIVAVLLFVGLWLYTILHFTRLSAP